MSNLLANAALQPFKTFEEASNYLGVQARLAEVLHLSFWYLQFEDGVPDLVIWVSTYDPEYMTYYMHHFTPLGDPVINSVMENHFVDWAEWFQGDEVANDVVRIAAKYGLTKYGISMPLQAPGQDKIIFSLCTNSDDQQWPALRSVLAKRFRPMAEAFSTRLKPLILAGQSGSSVFTSRAV